MSPRKKIARPAPKISEAEWIVMRVLWTRGSLTTNQVVDALGDCGWKPKTIHTLLARLVIKGALRRQKEGREYLFHSRVDAAACERALAQTFLDRFFNGELAPLLARCVEQERLTRAEIDELKQILDRGKR